MVTYSHLKHLCVSPYNYLQPTFRCSYIFTLKNIKVLGPYHHLIIIIYNAGMMAFLHLKHLGVGPHYQIQLMFRCGDFFYLNI